jgi:PAS domain S-box-containing protein
VYREAKSLAKEQFNDRQMLLAKQTSLGIEEDIKILIRELEILSKTPAVKEADLESSKIIISETFEYVKKLNVNDIGLLDSRGKVLLPLMAPQLTGKDVSFREYFRKASLLNESTPVYEFITFMGFDAGEKGIIIAMPIFKPGKKFDGVILFTIKVADMLKELLPSEFRNSKSWIIDSGKNIIYHPEYRPGTIIDQVQNIDKSFETFLNNIKIAKPLTAEYLSPDGSKTVAVSYPVKIADQTWSLVISTPEIEVSNLLKRFSEKYTFATLIVLLFILSTSFISIYQIYRRNIELKTTVKTRGKQLALSEEKLRELVETVNDWIWEVDTEGKYVYVSPRGRDLLGYEPEELIGKTAFSLMPEDVAEKAKTFFKEKVFLKKPFYNIEKVNIHKNGEPVNLETSGTPILDPKGKIWGFRGVDRDIKGKIGGFRGVDRDITERKRAEGALRESEEKFRELFNNANDAIYLWELREDGSPGRCIEVNDVACRMLGYSKSELLTLTPKDIDAEESIPKIPAIMSQLLTKGQTTFEMIHAAKDGRKIPVEINSHIFTLHKKKIILSITRDITERKRVENELRRHRNHLEELVKERTAKLLTANKQLHQEMSERERAEEKIRQQNEYMNSIIESLPHPFYVIDANDYTIKIANSAANKSGVSINSTCYLLTHNRNIPCGSEEHPCPLERVRSTKRPAIVEHIHYDNEGNAKTVEIHGYPFFDYEGNITQMIVYSQDITGRKRAEEQIKASLKEKEVLLGEIHHRVKNNLQVIYSLLSIQSGYVKHRQYSDIFKDCQNQIMSMALVHDKLYQTQNLGNINLQDYIKNLAEFLFTSYGINPTEIALFVDVENVSLGVDTVIICGLIINELVSNALKHAFTDGQSGEIKIALHSLGDHKFRLLVSDNGMGLPKNLDFKNTESFGLQMVNVLVEGRLRGEVELDRTNGTGFQIRFKEI